MVYRTKTYVAGDWTGDKDAIDQLYKWNQNSHLILSFIDAHDLTQARDSSLNCSIKSSLKKRMDASKTFVLVVGKYTKGLRSGSCQYCGSYNSWLGYCARGHSLDMRSYVDYECDKAVEAGIKIVVLYNSCTVDKNKCPDVLKFKGKHIAMRFREAGIEYWNYQAVRDALS